MDLLAVFRFLSEGKRKDAWAVSLAHQNFVRHMFKTGHRDIDPTHNLNGMYKGSLVLDFFHKRLQAVVNIIFMVDSLASFHVMDQ